MARFGRAAMLLLVVCGLVACGPSRHQVVSTRASISVPSFGDEDPHDWDGMTPWQYAVHGIDVSRYQGEIDWARAAASGVSFAFIKATEGGDVLDTQFVANWEGARAAGVARGAYHFYYFCRPAIEQARWFIRHVPRDARSLPPVLDMEWNHLSRTCPHRPAPSEVRAEMGVYLGELARHYGQRPIIYTTVDFYRENELWRAGGHEFWLRSVAGHPSAAYPGQRWTFWQYTGTGVVPGISGRTDINVFAGSRQQWQQWMTSRVQ